MVLPTFNEAGNILRLIHAIRDHAAALEPTVIVVDDNSPDGTGRLVRERFGEDPRVRLLVRTAERGLTSAIAAGVRLASTPLLAVMDTDFNHDPQVLSAMHREIQAGAEMVVGSRFVRGGGMDERLRCELSRNYCRILRLAVGSRIHDHLSGFWMARASAIAHINPADVYVDGYGDYFIRLLAHAEGTGVRIVETPVWYRRRTYGTSKTAFLPVFARYTGTVLRAARIRRMQRPAPTHVDASLG